MLLTIRNEQLRTFEKERRRQYLEALAARLHKEFPDALGDCTEEQELQFVLDGIEYAAAYGIKADDHVEFYLELMCRFGPRFDAFCPWARAVLRLALPPEQKIEGLQKGFVSAMEEKFGASDVIG